MGYYLNPSQEKDRWLAQYGEPYQDGESAFAARGQGASAICLVQNGTFSAAAIIYDKRELQAFTLPEDSRPKLWFVVPHSALEGKVFPDDWKEAEEGE